MTTFVQQGVGDVLLAWENEAILGIREFGVGTLEVITPSISILAEPSVAVVDQVVLRRQYARGGDGISAVSLQPGRTGDHREALSTARAMPTSRPNMRSSFRSSIS